MKRLIEYVPNDAESMVSRILLSVHQAIDEEFPNAPPAPSRFAKTVFGDEPTITKMVPSSDSHGMSEDSLREASERRQSARSSLPSSEDESLGEAPSDLKQLSDEEEVGSGLLKRKHQTMIGCGLLLGGLILIYLIW